MPEKFDYINHYKIDAEKFDYFEQRFGATKDDEKRLREYIISKVPKHPTSVMDVGCGSGWVAEHFLSKSVPVISSDIAFLNVKKVLKIFSNEIHSGFAGDSFNPPIKKEKLNVIISSEVIEHVVDPEKFIHSLYNLLDKNGILIISTPYKEILKYILCTHCNQKTPIHAHLHSFSEQDFVNIASKLQNVKFDYYIFGNKALIFLRMYVILKYLPFTLWKYIDYLANKILNKPAHLVLVFRKN
ncbi:MAG: class I SAM-dependent methyltransferase [bacterium]